MKRHWKSILMVIVVLVIVLIIVMRINSIKTDTAAPRQDVVLVKLEKPLRHTMTEELQYNGDIRAIQQANIFSKVGGNLERVYADIGQAVKKDQLLAQIDSTDYYQQNIEARASYDNAKLNYERTKELLQQNLLAQEDLDNAETGMKIAAANYEIANTQLHNTRIRAPFSGFITSRYLDPGALVEPQNAVLFTLMDLDKVRVIINVLEKDTPLIPDLKQATIVADALPDRIFKGMIARYSEAIDLSTRTMAVEINIENKNHTLKPGMFATVTLVVSQYKDAISLPSAAVQTDANGRFVFTVENNMAKRITVKEGLEKDNRIQIVDGLSGKESIITTGQQFVRDGSPVKVQN